MEPTVSSPPLRRLSSLLVELEDLKRQQPAHYDRSIASALFVEGWRRWLAGEDAKTVALRITTKALVAILLPGCEARFFREANLDEAAAEAVYRKSLRASARGRVSDGLYEQLEAIVPTVVSEYFAASNGKPPATAWFVDVLCRQPRAGATKPGKPRLLLVPPEMHSDHCLTTAVFAVLLAPHYGASFGQPFLTGLAHHLHNAVLPDCGFGGEVLLDPWLASVIRNARDQALADVNDAIAQDIRNSITMHENLDLAEGRAASAADVLDRVLDVQWRTRVAHVQNEDILSELDLVHEGPIKEFQTALLNEAGVWG